MVQNWLRQERRAVRPRFLLHGSKILPPSASSASAVHHPNKCPSNQDPQSPLSIRRIGGRGTFVVFNVHLHLPWMNILLDRREEARDHGRSCIMRWVMARFVTAKCITINISWLSMVVYDRYIARSTIIFPSIHNMYEEGGVLCSMIMIISSSKLLAPATSLP